MQRIHRRNSQVPRPVVLTVINDQNYRRQMSQAMDSLMIHGAVHLQRGADAVVWVAANDCALCVLDYDLPDMDGIQALVQMRQRKPRLPVIFTSGANDERVAVAAFRQGIVDYMTRSEPDSARLLAERISGFLESSAKPDAPDYLRRAVSVPAALRSPTYQNRLRVIGRQLDRYRYKSINLVEVAGGFLIRAQQRGIREPEALEFPNTDFPHLVSNAFEARTEDPWERATTDLLPTGYEDFLRTLGFELDERSAEAISIAEFDDIIVIGGVGKSDNYAASQITPFHLILRREDIEYRLNEAFRKRRAAPEQPPRRRGLRRFIDGS